MATDLKSGWESTDGHRRKERVRREITIPPFAFRVDLHGTTASLSPGRLHQVRRAGKAELVSKSSKEIFDHILYIASSPSPLILSEEVLTAERGKGEQSGDSTSRLGVLKQPWTMDAPGQCECVKWNKREMTLSATYRHPLNFIPPLTAESQSLSPSLLTGELPSPAARSRPSPAIAEIPVMARTGNQACTNISHAKRCGNPGYSAVTGLPNCIIPPGAPIPESYTAPAQYI
ncbi:hypothetical protein FA13DRAFT_1717368 [Coprinellus micaceus]|uniref:Uncharacterized protein n=1 Tax=Coprinellus micaceus TaxID=71717 RepID=A0A4Y7SGN4_COPMI|nr:hypothetical protein FA13DRAFT_1717368 [Coprinellus micaceus]